MAVALLFYETASTAFWVPHSALGVELTPNYHERTRLFGYSHMIGAIGMLLGLGALQLMNQTDEKRAFALGLSLFAGTIPLARSRIPLAGSDRTPLWLIAWAVPASLG